MSRQQRDRGIELGGTHNGKTHILHVVHVPKVVMFAAPQELADAHIVARLGTCSPALCGRIPITFWRRIWLEIVNDFGTHCVCAPNGRL